MLMYKPYWDSSPLWALLPLTHWLMLSLAKSYWLLSCSKSSLNGISVWACTRITPMHSKSVHRDRNCFGFMWLVLHEKIKMLSYS